MWSLKLLGTRLEEKVKKERGLTEFLFQRRFSYFNVGRRCGNGGGVKNTIKGETQNSGVNKFTDGEFSTVPQSLC